MRLAGGTDGVTPPVGERQLLAVAGGTGKGAISGQGAVIEQMPAQLDLGRGHRVVRGDSGNGKPGRQPPFVRRGRWWRRRGYHCRCCSSDTLGVCPASSAR